MAGEIGSFLGGFSGSTIGSAVVKLYLDSKAYQAEMAAAQAKTGTAATGMAGSLSKFKAYGGLAFAAVGTAAVAYGAQAISAARDQEEALNKVNVVFGTAAAEVRAFADQAATSLGLSETAALSAAGTFGNLFSNVGFTADATADMSTELVQLAGDLASFNNLDPTLALEKLRAGLAGEAEPLRAVGVFLSEAKVQAEAYESGIAKVGAELTDQQKIQARYNLILQETTLAQGDFERTSDSLANQQRILQAQMADLSATIGTALVPAVSELVGGLTTAVGLVEDLGQVLGPEYLDAFKESAKATSNLGFQYLELAGAIGKFREEQEPVLGDVRMLPGGLDKLNAVLEESEGAWDAVGDAVRGAGKAIVAAGRAMDTSVSASDKWREGIIDNLKATFGTISQFDNQWTISARQFQKNADKMAEQSAQLTEDLEVLATSNISDAIKKALLDEGPAAVHAFVESNRKGREAIVDDLQASQREFRDQKKLIEEMTGKIDVLGKTKAEAEVNIKYTSSGIPLDVLKNLPGIGDDG